MSRPAAAALQHLRAVRRLTRAVCGGVAPELIFGLAVESLLQGTQADRASMLLFDPDGVIRFKAWHGLPEDYRRAVEGHTPWSQDAVDPDPILVDDVAADPSTADLLPLFKAHDIAAVAFIPLYCGHLLGKFMLYYRAVHTFNPTEVELASVVADHVAFSVHRNRIEARVQAAHDHLDNILRHVGEGITVQDRQGRVLYANEAAHALLAPDLLTGANPTGQAVDRVELLDAHGHPFPPEQLPGRQAIQAGQTQQALLQLRERDTGRSRWTAVTASSMPDAHGAPAMAVNVFRDITALREAQQRLEENQQRLEEALAAAREAERRKDEFLAVLGHELRNPLAPIVTALQLMDLRDRAESEQPAPYASERALIARQVAHLRRLVDDLLDVSRITRGKLELDLRPMEVGEAVDGAVELVSPLLEAKGHTLRLQVPREGLTVSADPVRLTQVVENLLSNAARYTDPGGEIELVAEPEGQEVRLSVRDTGIGIRPELLAHIFDLFVQGPQTLERARGGLGLGLTIVRRLTEQHGGRVQAHSEGPGAGSEFVVHLPRIDVTQDEPSVSPPPLEGSAPPLQVLVVDDNLDAAQTLAEVLRMAGHTAHTAEDGPSALQIARGRPLDVAVLDLGLPVMDGIELGRRLRAMQPTIRLVAVTGYGQPRDLERTEEAGFGHHLVKPVDLGALLQAVGVPARDEGQAT